MSFVGKDNYIIKISREDGHGIDMETVRDYIPLLTQMDFPIKIKNHNLEFFGYKIDNPGVVD